MSLAFDTVDVSRPKHRSPVRRVLGAIRRRIVRPGWELVVSLPRILRNSWMRRRGRADHARWSSTQGLEAWWDERTKQIAGLIPANSRVLEFGAGRRQLERYLAAGCTYTPSDLVDRGAGTLVCDLNQRPLPNLAGIAPTVAVFGGVLEYIRDVAAIVQWLDAAKVKTCVASFHPAPKGLGLLHYRELADRTYHGYMNNLTEDQFRRTFESVGYVCSQRQTWTTQVIFQFEK